MRIIVVGGLSAGPSAAAKARRENENAEIILFEKSANISYATCGIPYALSGVIDSRDKLMVVKSSLLEKRFNIDVRLEEEVLNIDTKNKVVISSNGKYDYDKLMFATGASSIVPPIKNIEHVDNWSTCRSLTDFDKIVEEGMIDGTKRITVVGAGLIGVEVAENLAKAGKEVTLIEGANTVLPMWGEKFGLMAAKELVTRGVRVISALSVKAFHGDCRKAKQIELSNGDRIDTDFVVLSVGIKPNTKLLTEQGAKHLGNGALLVNENMETSIKDVYAAGDNVAIKNLMDNTYDYFPLGTHSNKGGRTAGANLVGKNISLLGAYKTAIIKVFDYTLARTGMNAKLLADKKIKYKRVLSVVGATPSYYPNAKDLIIELFYDPETKKVLGAELIGKYGVDKRVDVLSTAIYAGLTINDLTQLDLAYAPPFSPAKDPVVVSGHLAENEDMNKVQQIDVLALKAFIENPKQPYTLLDVRDTEELTEGLLPNATHIPLDELRGRLDELKDIQKPIFVYCAKGKRGYLASLIFKHNNFNQVFNLAGGYLLWSMVGEADVKNKISVKA